MANNSDFPQSIDNFFDPDPTTPLDDATNPHHLIEGRQNDAIASIQTKVGIDNSGDPNSLDFIIRNLNAVVTQTTALFTLPPADGTTTVTVAVISTANLEVGFGVFIPNAGLFAVNAIVDGTHVTLVLLPYPGNVFTGNILPNSEVYNVGVSSPATSGMLGLLPIPPGDPGKILLGNATWGTPAGSLPQPPPSSGAGSATTVWLQGTDSWQTLPQHAYTSAPFTVPSAGGTVSVSIYPADWPIVGGDVYFSDGTSRGFMDIISAAGSPVTSLILANNGNAVQGANVNANAVIKLAGVPRASFGKDGLLIAPINDGISFLRSDNAWAVPPQPTLPPGVILPFAVATPPSGYLLCDGTSYGTNVYPNLFNAIGYTFGGSGVSFNVPDLRGRTPIGAGQGTGLTNRVLGATLGEETHLLTVAKMASHTHGMDHSHNIAAGQFSHTHSKTDPGHVHSMDHYHNISAGIFTHTHVDAGHAHSYNQPLHTSGPTLVAGSGFTYGAENTGIGAAAIQNWNSPASNTVYASQTNAAWVNTVAAATGISIVAATLPAGVTATASATNAAYANTGSQGGGTGHNTMPPALVLTYIIKY
jgi:microcystin-dependent protein